MRDIVLLFFFPILLYFVFRRPFIGTSLWLWSAMFFPNGWVWGIASSLRFNMIIALATIISYVFQKNKARINLSGITTLILIFLFWTTISSFLTISDPKVVWEEWGFFLKIVIFYLLCTFTLNSKHHITVFIWFIVFSAGYLGATEGLKFILSLGTHTLKGISGSKLSDRNQLALALNMILPLMFFIVWQTKHKLLRLAMIAASILCIVAIIGSYSRGGFIGLIVVGGYFFLQSKRKFLISILLVVSVFSAQNFVSDDWSSRMNTINTMEKDSSFLGRVVAWKEAVLIAADNPFFGAGFKAGQNPIIWKIYEPDFSSLDFIYDTSGYEAPFAKAAHSIYFQVLGDQGIAGFLLFMLILYFAYRNFNVAIKNTEDEWIINLSKMLKVSLLAYCAGGAALSLPYFDLSFAIFALSHVLVQLSLKQSLQTVKDS